ncbi:MAG: cytidyltransferase [Elusimicrobiota bacterium]|nr:cytidyltransferase [Elusimicrobiota bacterium]
MQVYAFVPAKGTSERVENKNMRFLDGERLFVKALKTLLQCKEIDKVILDTDSEEIYEMVDYLPVEFMQRDKKLANNKTDGHKLLINEVKNFPNADIYVQMLCTSPFIKPKTIDNVIKTLKENKKYDSAVLVKKDKYYFWTNDKPQYNMNHIPNSIDLPETISESMGLYVIRKETALKLKRRFGDVPLLINGDLEELIDVNTPQDLAFAQIYAKGLRRKENERFKLISHFISSPSLSDIIDDINIEKQDKCGVVINGWQCNISNVKLFGRANTLKLRSIKENEDFRGIYNALHSYESISENDIIVVENEVADFAYFGDLNARLAIRSGAAGAIINGATRDIKQTQILNFPVFAKSINASDVRRRAVLDYMNKPIKIDGETVNPGNLIFIDECAMVVIYQKYEQEILKRVFNTFKNEKNIICDVLEKKAVEDIIKLHGEF